MCCLGKIVLAIIMPVGYEVIIVLCSSAICHLHFKFTWQCNRHVARCSLLALLSVGLGCGLGFRWHNWHNLGPLYGNPSTAANMYALCYLCKRQNNQSHCLDNLDNCGAKLLFLSVSHFISKFHFSLFYISYSCFSGSSFSWCNCDNIKFITHFISLKDF